MSYRRKTSESFSNLKPGRDFLGGRLLNIARSKSEDSLFTKDAQVRQSSHCLSSDLDWNLRDLRSLQDDDGSSRREMFIGPWRVDATDLPRTPRAPHDAPRSPRRSTLPSPARSPRSPHSPRSPLLSANSISRSDPEGLSARPPAATPSSARMRRHRFLETVSRRGIQTHSRTGLPKKRNLNIRLKIFCFRNFKMC